MKKININFHKLFNAAAGFCFMMAISSMDIPCFGFMGQPKMPEKLREISEEIK